MHHTHMHCPLSPLPLPRRDLAAEHLGLAIQGGEHSPVDDARAALYLYKRFHKARLGGENGRRLLGGCRVARRG